MTDLVIRQDIDGIALLTLNRPDKLNALNVALFKELHAHAEDIALQPDEIGCVVIKGAGRCFSAGHDLGRSRVWSARRSLFPPPLLPGHFNRNGS